MVPYQGEQMVKPCATVRQLAWVTQKLAASAKPRPIAALEAGARYQELARLLVAAVAPRRGADSIGYITGRQVSRTQRSQHLHFLIANLGRTEIGGCEKLESARASKPTFIARGALVRFVPEAD